MKILKNPLRVHYSLSSPKRFLHENPIPWLLSLVINPISRFFWRNLKEKMRRSRFFFKVEEGRGEEESVLMRFGMK